MGSEKVCMAHPTADAQIVEPLLMRGYRVTRKHQS
jgi:hypothetical protein